MEDEEVQRRSSGKVLSFAANIFLRARKLKKKEGATSSPALWGRG